MNTCRSCGYWGQDTLKMERGYLCPLCFNKEMGHRDANRKRIRGGLEKLIANYRVALVDADLDWVVPRVLDALTEKILKLEK